MNRARSQRFSCPERQYRHSPHVQPSQGTPTRAPSQPPAALDHGADNLVAENERHLRLRQLAVADVKVCTAHPARMDAEPHLALLELRARQLHLAERRPRHFEHHGPNPHGGEGYALGVDADAVELRVLGCLIEKQRTTPEQYPLSLNALRLASNQATNREPVVDYDEGTIRAALDRLSQRNWTRLASGPTSRVAKFRHLLEEALNLTPSQLAPLAVLMLRGPQTLGELRTRSERLYPFPSTDDVELTLMGLAERELVVRLPKRPGEREERWMQLLGGEDPAAGGSELAPVAAPADPDLEARVARLELEVAELRERLS